MKLASFTAMAAFGLLASAGVIKRQSKYESVAYWGQEEADAERSLGDYCAQDEGLDILIISFLYKFGNRVYPHGYLGECSVNADGTFDNCDSLAADIETCKSNGKKVFLSIGGAGAKFKLTGSADAKGVADSLWNSYANPDVTDGKSPRPFGDTFIDGWDLDIEDNPDNSSDYLDDLVNALRGYFADDTSNTYYISGAPQCPIPEANMGIAMKNAQFDYLFIQFYNNNCAAADLTNGGGNPDGDGQYNLADWPGYLSGGASANAKLHVGIPASTTGADDPYFYVKTRDLPNLIQTSSSVPGFNGVMLYDAGDSDIPNVNGCNYAQQVRRVLDTGSTC